MMETISLDQYHAMTTRKRSKYRNVKTTVYGIEFDSKKEAGRYLQLRDQLERGEIANLQMQVTYPLIVRGEMVCKYRADFVYDRDGVRVVEDVKGVKTDVYRIKKKLMLAVHGIEIKEV